MKIALVTASPKTLTWKSLPMKLKEVTKVLNQAQNAQFTIETSFTNNIPQVVNGRITKEWFDTLSFPLHEKGYDFVIFHFSSSQKKEWGINPTLGGSSFRDEDFIGEGWLYANENTKRKGHIRFIETFLHEMSHLIANGTGVLDKTHEEDEKKGTVKALFKTYDMSLWMKAQKISWLQKQLEKLQALLPQRKLQPLIERQANEILRSMDLLGMPMRITEGYRSIERQNQLYAQGRTTKGNIVTNAKGGESFHNYGVAVDFVFKRGYDVPESFWKTFGTVAISKGFEWGGNWKGFVDKPHVEMRLGYSLKDFQQNNVDYSKFK